MGVRSAIGLKRYLTRVALGVVLSAVFIGHAADAWRFSLIDTLESFIYDARLRMTAPGGVDERIVILDIDEKSLAELGHWPWRRDLMADIVNRLFDDYGVKLLGFDVVFPEPDTSSGLASLESIAAGELKHDRGFASALERLKGPLNYDRRFADALRNRSVVLGYYFNQVAERKAGRLPQPATFLEGEAAQRIALVDWQGYGANLPILQEAAQHAGHFSPFVDEDGIFRRVPLLVRYQGEIYESLSLAMARVWLGNPPFKYGPDLDWMALWTPQQEYRIPVDEHFSSLIPYRGPEGSFRYFSAVDVLKKRISSDELRGKIVLVGTRAPGLMDLRSTPVGSPYPGVEIHANLLAGILDQTIKAGSSSKTAIDVLETALAALLLTVLMPRLSPLPATGFATLVAASVAAVGAVSWSSGTVIPMASALAATLALYVFNMSWGFFVESRSNRLLTRRFGQYVPPELVAEMARDPERYSMEGRKAELSVLFSDVRGFTTISENIDSKELMLLMNEYLGVMTRIVQQNRGTLDKYMGDAVMAFWGAPVADDQHARHAVLTAMAMQASMREVNATFAARGWPPLQIGVGVNSGLMTVGDMGSPVRQSYTVMGDAVNLGSRLESVTKRYGVGIIIGEVTRALLPDLICRELDRVRVKGKDEPVCIYEPVGFPGDIDVTLGVEIDEWHLALEDYRLQAWDAAEERLGALQQAHAECKLYALFRERIAYYRDNPPTPDWDGVTNFETK